MDFFDEVRDGVSNKMTKYQQKMADYYNKRVKLRRLDIKYLVLRKVTPATKDPAQGKLNPTWEGPTGSLIIPDKAVITWKPWTDRDFHDHGILST